MASHGVSLDVIEDLDGLRAIEAEWNRVHDACEHRHVLLDHRFAEAWWRDLGEHKSMRILLLRREGVVEGIAPLMLSRGREVFPTRGKNVRIAEDYRHLPGARWRRCVPIRRLGFFQSFASSHIRSHLLLREPDAPLVDAVLDYCRGIRGEWDMLALDGIPDGSRQERLLRERGAALDLRPGRAAHHRVVLHARLPSTMEAFLQQRSANFRRTMRRARRAAEPARHLPGRAGDVHDGCAGRRGARLRILEYRGAGVDEGMGRMFALERESWKSAPTRARELHLQLDDRHRRFYRTLARSFVRADQAQVLIGELDGEPATGLFSIERGDMITCLLTYQCERLKDRVDAMPLWERFFRTAIDRQLRLVDFNGNNRHLARFANCDTKVNRLCFYHRGAYSRTLGIVADAATIASRCLTRRGERAG